jgi:hypothetical protein
MSIPIGIKEHVVFYTPRKTLLSSYLSLTVPRAQFNQEAETVRQRKETVIWFLSFVWLKKTN